MHHYAITSIKIILTSNIFIQTMRMIDYNISANAPLLLHGISMSMQSMTQSSLDFLATKTPISVQIMHFMMMESSTLMCQKKYLNTSNLPGMSLHSTTLKIDCPIILLYNLEFAAGFCNVIRMIVIKFEERIIEAMILMDSHAGERAFIT